MMNPIHFANNLVKLRKQKGDTQADVAGYVGVTVASVSKWETGQSYPDIAILPLLATYFDVSIDDLLGYSPQLSKADIARLYHKLGQDAAAKPFAQVLAECREVARKYYSCYPLLLQIGSFMLNYCSGAPQPEGQLEAIAFARQLFVRVQQESEDADDRRQALIMEAYCYLAEGDAKQVLVLLEGMSGALMIPPEPLVAGAYQMLGEGEKAVATLQSSIYQVMTVQISLFVNYLQHNVGDAARFEQAAGRALAIAEVYDLKHLHPTILLGLYIGIAMGYVTQQNKPKALAMLEQLADLLAADIYPLQLQGDAFFDKIDGWLAELDLQGQVPRSGTLVKKDLIALVTDNPAMAPLHGDERYEAIKKRLEKLKE